MRWSELLDSCLCSLSFTTGFQQLDWQLNEKDKQCAWELYVKLLNKYCRPAIKKIMERN